LKLVARPKSPEQQFIRTTCGRPLIHHKIKMAGKLWVTEFDVAIAVYENVVGLEVSMDDA
jgi:hypothetical protein